MQAEIVPYLASGMSSEDRMRRYFGATWKVISRAFSVYFSIGLLYGLWVFVLTGFRACGVSWCAELPVYHSRILNVLLEVLPDQSPYAFSIALGRALLWLPNMLLALVGHNGQTFLTWLLVRDVMPMPEFYAAVGSLLP